MGAISIHESLYVSGRSGLVTNCSQRLISASVVDTHILRIESQCPPGSLHSEPSMRQTARRKRAALPGRSLRGAPSHNPDGIAACGMRAGPSHSLSERLCRTPVDLLAAPACKSEVMAASRGLPRTQPAKRLLHRKELICWAWVAPLCSHEAIKDVSLTGGREEFTRHLRERGIVALGNRKIVGGHVCPAKVIR